MWTAPTTTIRLLRLAAAINSAGIGVKASVITDSSGSRLSLVSGTSGAAGQLTVTSFVVGCVLGRSDHLSARARLGQDASLTVDGVSITSRVEYGEHSDSGGDVSTAWLFGWNSGAGGDYERQ